VQAQDQTAGVAHHPCRHMQQPVAQRLGLGHGELAVQQQAWVQQVRSWAARTSSSQARLRRHRSKGRLRSPVALAARMRSSTRRAGGGVARGWPGRRRVGR
jgi:hypothetical protein